MHEKAVKRLLWFFYCIYLGLFVYFSLRHCRWFDESQAWLIARESNPFDLLQSIRYECHPFLWYLVLMVPAHLLPFSWFTLVTTCLVAISFYLLLFRAPYHLLLRLLLPATYFIFYQYGIIARSYVLFVTVALFAAATFPNRFRGKGFFLSVLLLLTLELHSLLVGVGLMAAFGLEVAVMAVRDKRPLASLRPYIVEVVVAALVALFVVGTTYPFAETYFTGIVPPVVVSWRRCFMLLTESLSAVNTFWMNRFVVHPGPWFTWEQGVALAAALGFYGLLCFFARQKRVLGYVVFPLVLLGLVLLFFYANSYHMGLWAPVLLFGSWIALDGVTWASCRFKKTLAAFFVLSLALVAGQINWTITGLCYEHRYPYSGLPALARYIKQHHLRDIAVDNINCLGVNVYFDRNIFRNVREKPYFIFSKASNIVPDKGSPRYVLTNYSLVTNRDYYRILCYFPGAIHDKGYSVSHDDTFVLYERTPH